MDRKNQTVTYLGDLKDCFIAPSETEGDGKLILRLNCGSPGITNFSSIALDGASSMFLYRAIGECFSKENQIYDRPLDIDLGWVRYLRIEGFDAEDRATISFDLGGMSNTFLGVTQLKIRVDRFALASLLPDYEKKLMRERYKKIGFLRRWLWRWLFGKAIVIGLPGVKVKMQ